MKNEKIESSDLGKDLVGGAMKTEATIDGVVKVDLALGGVVKMDGKILHHQFVKLGHQRRILTNELLALLPEIYECRIFKKYARTIEEYAARFGGLSTGVVQKRLRLEKYVYDKPDLRNAILTEGVHKVALVASLATVSNQAALADKVKNMSKPAVQELSKELRAGLLGGGSGNWSLFEGSAGLVAEGEMDSGSENHGLFDKSVSCKAIPSKITIELDEEMSFSFLKLKKMLGKNLSNKETIKMMMEKLLRQSEGRLVELRGKVEGGGGGLESEDVESEGGLTDQKVVPGDGFSEQKGVEKNSTETEQENFQNLKISEKLHKKIQNEAETEDKPKSHYIAVALRREKLAETNGKCSYPACNKPAENFHHTERFSEHKNHKSIKPLCKIHHEFMHNGLVLNQTGHQSDWQLSLDGELTYADHFYRIYRKGGG